MKVWLLTRKNSVSYFQIFSTFDLNMEVHSVITPLFLRAIHLHNRLFRHFYDHPLSLTVTNTSPQIHIHLTRFSLRVIKWYISIFTVAFVAIPSLFWVSASGILYGGSKSQATSSMAVINVGLPVAILLLVVGVSALLEVILVTLLLTNSDIITGLTGLMKLEASCM